MSNNLTALVEQAAKDNNFRVSGMRRSRKATAYDLTNHLMDVVVCRWATRTTVDVYLYGEPGEVHQTVHPNTLENLDDLGALLKSTIEDALEELEQRTNLEGGVV